MQQQRYHSFDCLRAAMMLLGIWMHGVQCYTQLNVYMWPFKDVARSQAFDFTINWVHIFRMPVFFVIAGFFFAMLATRRGAARAAANRAKRILLPFVLGWIVFAPVILATIGYVRNSSWAEALAVATNPANYWKHGPLHLWFLEYLLLLYPLVLTIDWLVRKVVSDRWLAAGSRLFRSCIQSGWRAPILAVLTIGPLASMGGWLATPGTFRPDLRISLAYLLFFGFGWVLYFERDILDVFKRGGWSEMAAGAAVTVIGYGVLIGVLPSRAWNFLGPLGIWLFLFGFLSLSLRYLDQQVSWIRYLSDASYWMYIVHVPVLIWVQILIAPLALPALPKGFLALTLTMPILLVSYNFAVRPTWIGAMLNGRRYPLRDASPVPVATAA
jgi:glucan biosynthesis protein C